MARRFAARLLTGLFAASLITPPAWAITNVVTDLGTLGGPTSYAVAVNDLGEVTGYADVSAVLYRAFLYSGGAMTDLGSIGSAPSVGHGINNAGDVVGYVGASGGNRGVLWSGGTITDIGDLGGVASGAYAINDAGDIVGWSFYPPSTSTDYHPILYSGGVMTDLGLLAGGGGEAYDINAGGDIVGRASNHAALWTAGGLTDLAPSGGSSEAFGINASGEIVGSARFGVERAVRFTGGVAVELGVPASFVSSAYGINDAGQIVGTSFRSTETFRRAFIHNAGMTTVLDRLLPPGSGWELRVARGIGNGGHVVGWGDLNGIPDRAFLLTLGTGCGNGLLDAGESCDDGNTAGGDGCDGGCATEPSWQCDGQPSRCRTAEQPVDGVRFVMRRTSRGDKLIFLSRDPNVLFPTPGGPNDPTTVGAAMDVFTDTEWEATIEMPASNWETSGSGLVHRFANGMAPLGVSTVRRAKVWQGGVKVVASAIPFEMRHVLLGAGVRVRTGAQWSCARFGPSTVIRDDPYEAFIARYGLASDITDCTAASLH